MLITSEALETKKKSIAQNLKLDCVLQIIPISKYGKIEIKEIDDEMSDGDLREGLNPEL